MRENQRFPTILPLYVVYFLIVLIAFSSCEERPVEVNITTDINNQAISQIIFSNPIIDIADTLKLGGLEPHILNLGKKPSIVQMISGRSSQYLYTEPGGNINVSLPEGRGEFVITGDFEKEQRLIEEFERKLGGAMGKYGPYKIMRLPLADFNLKLEEKYKELKELLADNDFTVGVNSDLITWLQARIDAGKCNDRAGYPSYFYNYTKKHAGVSGDYFSFIDDFDFNNEKAYYFEDVRNAVASIMSYDIDYEQMESTTAYYITIFKAVRDHIQNPALVEYFEFKNLMDKLNFDGGSEGAEDIINKFLIDAKSPVRKYIVKKEVSKWAHLKKGLTAPNFTAYTRKGKEVKLGDLFGKNIYIDVWATWCGPCISEIPALKAMEAKYHDDNVEFVSVSIDAEKDKQKWKDFVEEKALGGTQIMAENAWQSEIAARYNIMSIPRFIMVDASGKIVSANAPRPSKKSHFDAMMAEVLD